jgi:hypothetical protein
MNIPGLPPQQDLYDPKHENGRPAIVFVANIAMIEQKSPKGHRELPR